MKKLYGAKRRGGAGGRKTERERERGGGGEGSITPSRFLLFLDKTLGKETLGHVVLNRVTLKFHVSHHDDV